MVNKLVVFIAGAFLLLFFCTSVYAESLQSNASIDFLRLAEEKQLWKEDAWLNLLHYKRDWKLTKKSQIKSQEFFLSSQGSVDPKEELTETLKLFLEQKDAIRHQESIPGYCKYPARFHWLQKRLNLPDDLANFKRCKKLDKYLQIIGPKEVWLVFSSYFLNNPSSTFGHTFFRFSRPHHEGDADLLDHGINYAAVPTTSNPFFYAFYGIIGKFNGHFDVIPFYYKVREYSDYESRDLWSYRLSLTKEEKIRMAEHLWELGGMDFQYFFFTQNCSYHMLSLLEVARPSLKLVDSLPLWVIPSDSVITVNSIPDLVDKVDYRPSLYRRYREQVSSLTADEYEILLELNEKKDLLALSHLSADSQLKLLDVSLDHWEIKSPSVDQQADPQINQYKYDLLISRSKMAKAANLTLSKPFYERPDIGHSSARFGLGVGHSKLFFDQRFAHHDLLDPSLGYPERATIEFVHLVASYQTEEEKYALDHLSVVKVQALNGFDRLEKNLSWQMDFGLKENSKLFFTLGAGLSYIPKVSTGSIFAFLINSLSEYRFESSGSGYYPGLSFEALAAHSLSQNLKAAIKYERQTFFDKSGYSEVKEAQIRYAFHKNQAFDLKAKHRMEKPEAILSYYYYY